MSYARFSLSLAAQSHSCPSTGYDASAGCNKGTCILCDERKWWGKKCSRLLRYRRRHPRRGKNIQVRNPAAFIPTLLPRNSQPLRVTFLDPVKMAAQAPADELNKLSGKCMNSALVWWWTDFD